MRDAARSKRRLLGVFALLVLAIPRVSASAAQQAPGPWMQLADPEAAGWSSAALEEARQYAVEIGTTSAMVLERGRVVAAWGDVTTPRHVFSIRKSLLGALYGIGVERGEIDLSVTMAELGIDDEPPLTEQERGAKIADLLRARSGVYHTAAFETSGMEAYRPERDSYEPGTHWFYNNWDFNTLATVSDLDLVFVHLHERVNSSVVGSPDIWTLLDRIVAARAGTAYRGTGATVAGPSAEPALVGLRPEPLGASGPRIGAEFMEDRKR